MAINDVLPLKAARHDCIANFKCFWSPPPPAYQRLIFRWFHLHSLCGSTLFGWCHNYSTHVQGVGKNVGLIISASRIVLSSWKWSQNFKGGNPSKFSRAFLNFTCTSQHVAKFGWVLLSHLLLRRLRQNQQTAFMEGGCKTVNIKVILLAACGPKFMKFQETVRTLGSCQRRFPILYVMFCSEDIRY